MDFNCYIRQGRKLFAVRGCDFCSRVLSKKVAPAKHINRNKHGHRSNVTLSDKRDCHGYFDRPLFLVFDLVISSVERYLSGTVGDMTGRLSVG